MTSSIAVRHNIEVAHRLSLLPGKCEAILGHSMWVRLELWGPVDRNGILAGLDFGALKKDFRGHLDRDYDHRLLLNANDPLAELDLPGLRECEGDPTTENIARWVGEWARNTYPTLDGYAVTVDETHVNAASWRA
jgi:6-pyruvoyl-tetrahydropterin synthase